MLVFKGDGRSRLDVTASTDSLLKSSADDFLERLSKARERTTARRHIDARGFRFDDQECAIPGDDSIGLESFDLSINTRGRVMEIRAEAAAGQQLAEILGRLPLHELPALLRQLVA